MKQNYAERIFSAMKPGIQYSPESISEITHIDQREVNRIFKMLVSGMVVEELTGERFIRNRRFATKQLGLCV